MGSPACAFLRTVLKPLVIRTLLKPLWSVLKPILNVKCPVETPHPGEEVAVKVQRPGIEPIIYQDLVLFRFLAGFINSYALKNLGTSAQVGPLCPSHTHTHRERGGERAPSSSLYVGREAGGTVKAVG